MAKRIKPIKCPQCGSTQATETKTDYYRCNSCHSEFFIDSDDINIHHRHTYDTPQFSVKHLKALKFLGLGIAVFFAMMMVISLFPSQSTYSPATIQANKPYWDIEQIIPTSNKEGEPIAIVVGDIVSGNYPNQTYKPTFGFFHATTFKEIAAVPIDIEKVGDVSYKKMDEGKTYIVINKNRLFLLDENALSINEITPQSIGLPEFDKGFAKVETNSAYQNSLRITNNLGKEYYYFPMMNKAFREDAYAEVNRAILESPTALQEITRFAFSKASLSKDEGVEDKLPELFKVKTQGQVGYPYKWLYLRWSKKGLYIDKESRVTSYENFTPERTYLKPEVLHYDENEVFILFKYELAEGSPYFFQGLDAQTGEVKFTVQRKDMDYLRDDYVAKTKDGYLITLHGIFLLNTKEGNLEELELREALTQR